MQFGSVVATMSYDGLGRRIKKAVANSGDWNCTYHYYYNGQQMVETRNDSGFALSQNVWGLQYVDELVQIMHAPFPGEANKPNHPFWVLQDANFNTLGVVSRTGRLVERYEYTPYGQRTVFSHGYITADFDDDGDVDLDDLGIIGNNWGMQSGATLEDGDADGDGDVDLDDNGALADNWGKSVAYLDDPLVMYPRLGSYVATSGNPLALCDIGHQGLPHDREFGLLYNRMRYYSPTLARFTSRDPLMYVDGMSMYEYVRSSPTLWNDPLGLCVDKKEIARGILEKAQNDLPLTRDEWDIVDQMMLNRIELIRTNGLVGHSWVRLSGPILGTYIINNMPDDIITDPNVFGTATWKFFEGNIGQADVWKQSPYISWNAAQYIISEWKKRNGYTSPYACGSCVTAAIAEYLRQSSQAQVYDKENGWDKIIQDIIRSRNGRN